MNRMLKASSLLLSSAVVVQVARSASFAEQPRRAKPQAAAQPKASADAPPAAPPVADAQQASPSAVEFFKIAPRQAATGGDREIHTLVAELISRQAEKERSVPDGRARHFSWIKLPIRGWAGDVMDHVVLPTGLRVRVRVIPDLGGGCCAVGQYTDETYLITNGVVRLTTIEYSDRNGPRIITWN